MTLGDYFDKFIGSNFKHLVDLSVSEDKSTAVVQLGDEDNYQSNSVFILNVKTWTTRTLNIPRCLRPKLDGQGKMVALRCLPIGSLRWSLNIFEIATGNLIASIPEQAVYAGDASLEEAGSETFKFVSNSTNMMIEYDARDAYCDPGNEWRCSRRRYVLIDWNDHSIKARIFPEWNDNRWTDPDNTFSGEARFDVSPDGNQLIVWGERSGSLFDLRTGVEVKNFPGSISGVAFEDGVATAARYGVRKCPESADPYGIELFRPFSTSSVMICGVDAYYQPILFDVQLGWVAGITYYDNYTHNVSIARIPKL